MMKGQPKTIYLFSGKRKSGKDYITDILFNRLDPEKAVIIRLSAPIKFRWACEKSLDYEKLLGTSEYKEAERKGMLEWSEKVRNEDYGYFCRAAIEMSKAENKPVWIISDARRKTDVKWFKENYGDRLKTFRIVADEECRKQRGWVFTEGIDDCETECGLDEFSEWTEIILNNGTENLDLVISKMVDDINTSLSNAS